MSSNSNSEKPDHHMLITEFHVKAALEADKGNSAKLLSWTIHDFTKKGDNFASVVTSVHILYCLEEESLSTSYIVKINPGHAVGDYKILMSKQFIKESGIYEKIVPSLNLELVNIGEKPLRLPRWIHSSIGDSKDLIFLEDLRQQGFKMRDVKSGLDVPHALLVLEELAKLHASSVLLQAKHEEDLALKYSFLKADFHNYSENAEQLCGNIFAENFVDVYNMLKKVDGYDVVKNWINEHKTKAVDIFIRELITCAPFDVICHGDCWSNNMLFKYNNEGAPVEMVLFDLQVCRKASLGTDLNHFMYTNFNGDVRKTNLNQFLTCYHDEFSKIIGKSGKSQPFTKQELLEEYRNKNAFGLLFGMFSTMLIMRPKEEVPDFITARNEDEFWKENTISEKSLDVMNQDPLFWPRLLAIFDDMLESRVIA